MKQSSPGTQKYNENQQRIHHGAINPFTLINQNIESFKVISKNTDKSLSRGNSSTANFFQNSQSRKCSIPIHKNENHENSQNPNIPKNLPKQTQASQNPNSIRHFSQKSASNISAPTDNGKSSRHPQNFQGNVVGARSGYMTRKNSGPSPVDRPEIEQKELFFMKRLHENGICGGNYEKLSKKDKKEPIFATKNYLNSQIQKQKIGSSKIIDMPKAPGSPLSKNKTQIKFDNFFSEQEEKCSGIQNNHKSNNFGVLNDMTKFYKNKNSNPESGKFNIYQQSFGRILEKYETPTQEQTGESGSTHRTSSSKKYDQMFNKDPKKTPDNYELKQTEFDIESRRNTLHGQSQSIQGHTLENYLSSIKSPTSGHLQDNRGAS
jgi:hypothetical protein